MKKIAYWKKVEGTMLYVIVSRQGLEVSPRFFIKLAALEWASENGYNLKGEL